VAIHQKCIKQLINKAKQHHRHNNTRPRNANINTDTHILRCPYCRGKDQANNNRIKKKHIIQTTIEWQKKEQDEKVPDTRQNNGQQTRSITSHLKAYVGHEKQGTIEIFEIDQRKHRHAYRRPPPLHTLKNKRRIRTINTPRTQCAAMTRNPTQHERKQRRAAAGGGGGGVAEANGAEEPRKNARRHSSYQSQNEEAQEEEPETQDIPWRSRGGLQPERGHIGDFRDR